MKQHFSLLLVCLCVATLAQSKNIRKEARMLASSDLADGIYVIKYRDSDKVFDITGASTQRGAQLIQYTYNGGKNQQFKVEKLSSGSYKITAVHSGLVLDVSGASTADGARVIQWTSNGQTNQQWRLSPIQTCDLSTSTCTVQGYQIVSVNSGLVLTVEGNSSNDAANIIQSYDPEGDSYLFRFFRVY